MSTKEMYGLKFEVCDIEIGEVGVPDRHLDYDSPATEILELLEEYIIRHMFVTRGFKLSNHPEVRHNRYRCEELQEKILNSGYSGSFVWVKFGYAAIVNVFPGYDDKYERLTIHWRTIVSQDFWPQKLIKGG